MPDSIGGAGGPIRLNAKGASGSRGGTTVSSSKCCWSKNFV